MLVNERLSFGRLDRVGHFSFPHHDLGPLPFPYDLPVEGLGKSVIKKIGAAHRKVFKKIVPKSIRKALKKFGGKFKTYFVKLAPILSIAAQVLNFIPGLGVAVGLAITAGAAAINLSEQSKAAKAGAKASKEAVKESDAELVAAEAAANEKANAAFATGEEYFTKRYGITRADFEASPLDEKLAFLQQAVEDRQKEATSSMYIYVAGGVLVLGALAIILIKKKRQQQKR